MEEGGQQLGRLDAILCIIAKARHGSWLVVIAQVKAVPAPAVQLGLPAAHHPLEIGQVQRLGLPFARDPARLTVEIDMLELEQHVERAALGLGQLDTVLHRGHGRFAHGDDVGFLTSTSCLISPRNSRRRGP